MAQAPKHAEAQTIVRTCSDPGVCELEMSAGEALGSAGRFRRSLSASASSASCAQVALAASLWPVPVTPA